MKDTHIKLLLISAFLIAISCSSEKRIKPNPDLLYRPYQPHQTDKVISREDYYKKLQGFWLGTCIANWTGLVTEMDKIGNIGDIKTDDFYTRDDWGEPDQPSIWGQGIPS
ncbi:MAG: hypothetical protein MI866_06200, partial [Bacteroidales bacterium]|nr:hypothetical protein [Bacteroidales bacterium]